MKQNRILEKLKVGKDVVLVKKDENGNYMNDPKDPEYGRVRFDAGIYGQLLCSLREEQVVESIKGKLLANGFDLV